MRYSAIVDVVSDAIAIMRTGEPSSSRARLTEPGGRRFAAYAGAGFHLMLEGTCWLIPDQGEPVTVSAGDAVLLPHGAAHALAFGVSSPPGPEAVARFPLWDGPPAAPRLGPAASAARPADVLCGKYRLDRSRSHPLLTEMPDVVTVATRPGRHGRLRSAIDLLGAEVDEGEPGADTAVRGLLDLLLVYLLRAWIDEASPAGATGWRQALADPPCAGALRAIHSDASHRWSMPELAQRAGVSRATLARRFAAWTGTSPMAYLTWWRMTCAARLLRESDAPLRRIADQVGYSSPFAFSHAFTRHHGTAPDRYRRADIDPSAHPTPPAAHQR